MKLSIISRQFKISIRLFNKKRFDNKYAHYKNTERIDSNKCTFIVARSSIGKEQPVENKNKRQVKN